jgi:hypothetical protein
MAIGSRQAYVFTCSGCSTSIQRLALRVLSPRSKIIQKTMFPHPNPPRTMVCVTEKFFVFRYFFLRLCYTCQIKLFSSRINSAMWRFSFSMHEFCTHPGQDTGHHMQRWFLAPWSVVTDSPGCWRGCLHGLPSPQKTSSNLSCLRGQPGFEKNHMHLPGKRIILYSTVSIIIFV